jgi:hypothetical protein
MDISDQEKKDKYYTYEPSKRIIFDDLIENEDLNINIICDTSVTSVSYSNYYLYWFIFYLVLLIILYIISHWILKDNSKRVPKMLRKKYFKVSNED